MASIEEARSAKDHLRGLLRGTPEVNGVGVTRRGEGWAVRVNLVAELPPGTTLPHAIDDVPIEACIVGAISSHAG